MITMPRFSLSALGVDRPGIAAALSAVLVDLQCNLEDSTMSILQGHFAVLLVIAAPDAVTVEALDSALAPVARELDLVVAVRSLTDTRVPSAPADGTADSSGEPWTVAVHGADHTGIVHGITSALADGGGNVVDLATHLVGEPDAPVYVMTLRVVMPAGRAGEVAAETIRQVGAELGVHCTVLPDPADIL